MLQPAFEIRIKNGSVHVVLVATPGKVRVRGALTGAEKEIIARIFAGQSNAEIAAARAAALRTVANQVAALLRKLRAASRHELLPAVIARGGVERSELDGEIRVRFEHGGDLYMILLQPAAQAPHTSLRPREQAVVERVARGMSDKQIAYELGIAVSSVSTMLWRARQRVGLGGRGSIVLSWLAMADHRPSDLQVAV